MKPIINVGHACLHRLHAIGLVRRGVSSSALNRRPTQWACRFRFPIALMLLRAKKNRPKSLAEEEV